MVRYSNLGLNSGHSDLVFAQKLDCNSNFIWESGDIYMRRNKTSKVLSKLKQKTISSEYISSEYNLFNMKPSQLKNMRQKKTSKVLSELSKRIFLVNVICLT